MSKQAIELKKQKQREPTVSDEAVYEAAKYVEVVGDRYEAYNALRALLVDCDESLSSRLPVLKPLAKPKPKSMCGTFCRHYLKQLRADTGVKTAFKVSQSNMGYEVWADGRKFYDGDACCKWDAQAQAVKAAAAKELRCEN